MRNPSRVMSLVLASIVALGIATVPAVAASAATPSAQSAAKTGTLSVQVVDVKGNALNKRIWIAYEGTGTQWLERRTDAKGALSFTGMKPGTGSVEVSSGNTYIDPVATRVTITAGKTTRARLKVIVGATISGTVLDAAGKPVEDIPVIALKSQKVVGFAYTSSKGTYSMAGLKTGSYKVAFNPEGYSDWASTSSFWKNGTSAKNATIIKLTQQTTKKRASFAKHIDGIVTKKPVQTLTGTINMLEPQKFAVEDPTTGTGEGLDVVDGKFSVELPVGTYTIWGYGVVAGHTKPAGYWYTGDGIALTTKSEKAVTFTLTEDGPLSIVFGAPAP